MRIERMPRGSVAQLVERSTENRKVTGSMPVGATTRPPDSGGLLLCRVSTNWQLHPSLHPMRLVAYRVGDAFVHQACTLGTRKATSSSPGDGAVNAR